MRSQKRDQRINTSQTASFCGNPECALAWVASAAGISVSLRSQSFSARLRQTERLITLSRSVSNVDFSRSLCKKPACLPTPELHVQYSKGIQPSDVEFWQSWTFNCFAGTSGMSQSAAFHPTTAAVPRCRQNPTHDRTIRSPQAIVGAPANDGSWAGRDADARDVLSPPRGRDRRCGAAKTCRGFGRSEAEIELGARLRASDRVFCTSPEPMQRHKLNQGASLHSKLAAKIGAHRVFECGVICRDAFIGERLVEQAQG